MRHMLRSMGVAAAAANLPSEFSNPDMSETRDINNRYGKVIRDNKTARSNFSGFVAKPGANMNIIQGMVISIKITNIRSDQSKTAKACSANSCAR